MHVRKEQKTKILCNLLCAKVKKFMVLLKKVSPHLLSNNLSMLAHICIICVCVCAYAHIRSLTPMGFGSLYYRCSRNKI